MLPNAIFWSWYLFFSTQLQFICWVRIGCGCWFYWRKQCTLFGIGVECCCSAGVQINPFIIFPSQCVCELIKPICPAPISSWREIPTSMMIQTNCYPCILLIRDRNPSIKIDELMLICALEISFIIAWLSCFFSYKLPDLIMCGHSESSLFKIISSIGPFHSACVEYFIINIVAILQNCITIF